MAAAPGPRDPNKTTPSTPNPPQDPPADGSSGNSGAASLTSIGMLVAPLIAALAGLALTGTIGRVQRDEPVLFSVAIGLVIASGVLWVAAETFTAPKTGESRNTPDIVLRSIAFLFAGAGFIIALAAAVATANNESRPQISSLVSDDGAKLTTHVTASNLRSDHRLAFRIDLLQDGKPTGSLYRAYVGPNSDGTVDQTVTNLLPAGKYDEIGIKAYTGTTSPGCDDFKAVKETATFGSGTGCVIMRVPPREQKPQPPQPAPPMPPGQNSD